MASLVHRLPKHPPCPAQALRTRCRCLASLAAPSFASSNASSSPAHVSHGSRVSTLEYSESLLAAAVLAQARGHILKSDSDPNLPTPSSPPPEHEISDQEWETRTGRAIYILQQTLPEFFTTGLVSSLELPSTSAAPPSVPSPWRLSWLGLLLRGAPRNGNGKGKEKEKQDGAEDSIYSPRVRLVYTPPNPLPTPLPQTLSIEGLHLYIASSIFVRHTLNALYTDLNVVLRRVRVHGSREKEGFMSPGSIPPPPRQKKSRSSREKSVSIGLSVTGLGRVSRALVEWQVDCTYTFSPQTGLILQHTVDSIEPAPHQALFEALSKLGFLGGMEGPASKGV